MGSVIVHLASSYKGLDGSVKKYVEDNDTDIEMTSDILSRVDSLYQVREQHYCNEETNTQDKGDSRQNIPEISHVVVEDFQLLVQLNSEFDFVHGYLHCLEPTNYVCDKGRDASAFSLRTLRQSPCGLNPSTVLQAFNNISLHLSLHYGNSQIQKKR